MQPEIPARANRELEEEFPQVDSLASDVVINVWRTSALLSEDLVRVLRPSNLTLTGFRVLMMLRAAGGTLSPAEIAARLGSARATVTGVLDSLEKRSSVLRSPHPEDRRRLQISITDSGRALLDEILPAYFTHERDAVAALDPGQQEAIVTLLGELQRGLYARRSDG
jgi:MarR family transcriptional regulator, negative regulator of the multidrug operon emrRAB